MLDTVLGNVYWKNLDPSYVFMLSCFFQDTFESEKVQEDGAKPVNTAKQGNSLPGKEMKQKQKSIKRNDTNSESLTLPSSIFFTLFPNFSTNSVSTNDIPFEKSC